MGDSLEATAVLPDVAQAPVEKVVAYIRYRIYDSMQEPLPLHTMRKTSVADPDPRVFGPP